jgi:hypothetical protein
MRILISDDNNDKVARLLETLRDSGIARDDVAVAFTITDTRRELRNGQFDILILDVLLPLRGGDVPKHNGTLDLLTEISERNTLIKPRYTKIYYRTYRIRRCASGCRSNVYISNLDGR